MQAFYAALTAALTGLDCTGVEVAVQRQHPPAPRHEPQSSAWRLTVSRRNGARPECDPHTILRLVCTRLTESGFQTSLYDRPYRTHPGRATAWVLEPGSPSPAAPDMPHGPAMATRARSTGSGQGITGRCRTPEEARADWDEPTDLGQVRLRPSRVKST